MNGSICVSRVLIVMNQRSRANRRNGVALDDSVVARAAVDDRGRSLFSGLTCLCAVLLAVGSLSVLGRSLAGRGEALGALQVAAAVIGLVVDAVVVWLVVRGRRAQRWALLFGACGICLGWMAVMALAGRA
ncbi:MULTISPECIES: hypothetical protein [unclassified Streptomyces]|uniref:hypothetical protein n=1 Tax=unclassified Streptomyces TaxID=2593676 RepID=UPI002E2F1EF7|nr:hypothetical protein [Streptomyces sp. NBC_00696]